MSVAPELGVIRKNLVNMGRLAKSSMKISIEALMSRDSGLCDQVESIEKESDHLNLDVEDMCFEVLSSQKLHGKTFRFVTNALYISGRFERIADHAVEIAEYCRRGLPKPLFEPILDLPEIRQIVEEMIDMVLEALSRDEIVSMEKIRAKDRDMKNLGETIYGNFVSYIRQHPEAFDDAMLQLRILLTLERIGEVACKIASKIVYVEEGKRVWL